MAIAVSGAGFTIPNSETGGSYSLDVALFNRDVWVPGDAGEPQWVSLSEDSRNGQYYQAYMAYYGGSFETVIQVPAGALSADKPYGVGTLLRHYAGGVNTYENRGMDTLSEVADPVLVEIVDPEPEPGTEPGTDPGTEPGTEPGTDPSTEPGADPSTEPGTDPSTEPGTDPSTELGTDPSTELGTDPSTEPGTDPSTEPGTDPGTGVTPAQPQTGTSPGGQGTSAKLAQTGSRSLRSSASRRDLAECPRSGRNCVAPPSGADTRVEETHWGMACS